MLPNANGAVVTILGLMSAGRVPAMINFTAGARQHPRRPAGRRRSTTILTSRAFIEKGRLDNARRCSSREAVELVYLEDIRAERHAHRQDPRPAAPQQAAGRAQARRLGGDPVHVGLGGSVPKGVVLSHRNMLANAAQAAAASTSAARTRCSTCCRCSTRSASPSALMLPLVFGVPIYLYPSPLHYRTVAELIYGVNATIMFGTDTFLDRLCARGASVRLPLAALHPGRRRAGEGIDAPRSTWRSSGCASSKATASPRPRRRSRSTRRCSTSSAPSAASCPAWRRGWRRCEGVEEGGRLFVRGPNVMLGYLKVDKPGVLEPPPEGWHDTGDIVTIDEQGFVAIKGRAKRFAKVGGEMISLAAVEMLAGDLLAERAVGGGGGTRRAQGRAADSGDPAEGRHRARSSSRSRASRHASELMIPAEYHDPREDADARLRQGRHDEPQQAGTGARRPLSSRWRCRPPVSEQHRGSNRRAGARLRSAGPSARRSWR